MIKMQVLVFLKSVGAWQVTSLALPFYMCSTFVRSFSFTHTHAQARARAQSVETR